MTYEGPDLIPASILQEFQERFMGTVSACLGVGWREKNSVLALNLDNVCKQFTLEDLQENEPEKDAADSDPPTEGFWSESPRVCPIPPLRLSSREEFRTDDDPRGDQAPGP